MLHKSSRNPNGNLRYMQEHTAPDTSREGSLLPGSNQFEDTQATLGISSRGFHFTGQTTEDDVADATIHSSKSLLYDDRDNNEAFIESRNGSRLNPSFKTPIGGPQTTGAVPSGTDFWGSTAEPIAQGASNTTGPSWWDRIVANWRNGNTTQSTNLGIKPPEKFQIGLRSSENKVVKPDQNRAKLAAQLATGSMPGSTRGT